MTDSKPNANPPGSKSVIFAVIAILCVVILNHLIDPPPPHRSHSPRHFCFQNLRTIQNAKELWALEHDASSNSIPTEAELFGVERYIPNPPSCPIAGEYQLGRISERVRCSIHGEAP